MSSRHVVALVAAVLLLAPTVAAQEVGSDVSVEIPDLPEVASGTEASALVEVTYSWDDGAIAAEDTDVTINVTVDFGPLQPWASASVQPEQMTFSPGPQSGSQTQTTNLTVTVQDGAPAAVPATITVTANASENGAIASSEGNDTADAFAAPSYDVRVDAPASIELSGGSGTVEIGVTNQGNGPVGVSVVNGSAPAPVRIQVTPPERSVLGPGGEVQANADAFDVSEAVRDQLAADPSGTFLITLEGSASGTATFDVAYGPAGNATTVAGSSGVQIQIQGGGLPLVPLLIVVFVAAAVGGGYYLYRERREEDPDAGEPVLTPLDASEVDEANEGETWLEVPADEEEE